jgi:peptidoglycan/LPS O-acetylase OafA/YrhL
VTARIYSFLLGAASRKARNNSVKRLLTIDFLRGIAALGVMLFHAGSRGIFGVPQKLTTYSMPDAIWMYPISFGFTGVVLFFVISGFCIHLRWVKEQLKAEDGQSLEFFSFWKRRFRRLYPAYIVALGLYIFVQYQLGIIQFDTFFIWDLISHILMIHNLDNQTVYSFNGVFWTLAIEEQLYLAYFLLLYFRKRVGWKTTLIFCLAARLFWFALSFAVYQLLGYELPISESALSNWWIWALGAYSVEAYFGLVQMPRWCRSFSIGSILLICIATLYCLDWVGSGRGGIHNFLWLIMQPMWGLGFFILLNSFISLEYKLSGLIMRIVSIFAWIGLFSYSLYLTHELVFLFIPTSHTLARIVVSILFAWGFYLLFEKPFFAQMVAKEMRPAESTA